MPDTYGKPNEETPLLVAVDGGGSGCRVLILNRQGKVVGAAQGGSANVVSDYTKSLENIEAAVHQAYQNAGIVEAKSSKDTIVLGLAGAESDPKIDRLKQHLDFGRVLVYSDLEATVRGALGNTNGTVVGIGTGSFFCTQVDGKLTRTGGWGFHLSDDCSGAAIGRTLLRMLVKMSDGMVAPSPLLDSVFGEYDRDIRSLVAFATTATPSDYARYARQIVNAYDAGDPAAKLILEEARDILVGYLDFVDAAKHGGICFTGGLGPKYIPLLPKRYRALSVAPKGSALDGLTQMAMPLIEKVQ